MLISVVNNHIAELFAGPNRVGSQPKANCQKSIVKLDLALPQNFNNNKRIMIFRLPYMSLKKPHNCDIKVIPGEYLNERFDRTINMKCHAKSFFV